MIPILLNATSTVGLVETANPKSHFIMGINPLLLKQWADMVLEQYPDEDLVYLSVHPAPDRTAKALAAADELGEELQVMVCGVDCDEVVVMKE